MASAEFGELKQATFRIGEEMDSFEVQTHRRTEFLDITDRVREAVRRRGVGQGVCVVYCPHTTAAITINENADPDVVHDILAWLQRTIPQQQADFRHGEGNSDAHIKSSLVGASAMLLVESGDLVLGRWQGVYFCEFDGPRRRTVHVQCLGS
jgi:secondary thiamine-phosphate synthase enzyme